MAISTGTGQHRATVARIAVCVLEREHPWQVGQFYKTTSIYLN